MASRGSTTGGSYRRWSTSQARPDVARCTKGYGPHKTIYDRLICWSKMGVFNRIFAELAGEAGEPDAIMIDATQGTPHGGEPSKRVVFLDLSGAPGAG